jgi:hypothetical protein
MSIGTWSHRVALLAARCLDGADAQRLPLPAVARTAAPGGPQVADTAFIRRSHGPPSARQGTARLLDEAHNNFHTVEGRYAPFADVLRRDGFVVDPLREDFTESSLARGEFSSSPMRWP